MAVKVLKENDNSDDISKIQYASLTGLISNLNDKLIGDKDGSFNYNVASDEEKEVLKSIENIISKYDLKNMYTISDKYRDELIDKYNDNMTELKYLVGRNMADGFTRVMWFHYMISRESSNKN